MDTNATFLSYSATGYFSTILNDYITGEKELAPFYCYPVSAAGIQQAINQRNKFKTNRSLLAALLTSEYSHYPLTEKQSYNIAQLANDNVYTICTAHQPNIFTGHLYFIYKILHAVKMAAVLSETTDAYFVPVYYMGSEDADLDELGHIYTEGVRRQWHTKQTGAVGRMKVDNDFLKVIDEIEGQLTIHPFGADIIALMKNCYTAGTSIEQATFKLVNSLFASYGLLILLPDSASVKKAFAPVMRNELLTGFSHTAVEETATTFPARYKVQASGRAINLFYLTDTARERIVLDERGNYSVINSTLTFTKEQILEELEQHPERFSPNVILRPLLQEMILPNIAFIGGGGEIAYWLELKKVFDAACIPYPMLVTRNSFLLIENKYALLAKKLKVNHADLFKSEAVLISELVKKASSLQLSLQQEIQQLNGWYEKVKHIAALTDPTLRTHTEALQQKAIKKIIALEKKLLQAEKKKFAAQQRQLHTLKAQLFPGGSLQERVENFMPFYARWGNDFFTMLYNHSLSMEQQLCIIETAQE